MKLESIYSRSLAVRPNPAISATDLSEETVKTEIKEYVFTKEIINHLCHILKNIYQNEGSHTGIWINGYYGSGKSHFLKYVDYCLSEKFGEMAFDRLIEAVNEYEDPMELDATPGEIRTMKKWYLEKGRVQSVIMNLGVSYNGNSDSGRVFTSIFWNELNKMRGYNGSQLALAQYLEKPLDERGLFGTFKQRLADDGFDWNTQAVDLAVMEIDYVLDLAKELVPSFSIDVMRRNISTDRIDISVEAFCREVKEYVDKQNSKDFRLIFFVDEVSQFIGDRSQLLLQLQEIVARLPQVCGNQVWVACTAQQELDEVINATKVTSTSMEVGKILGRFEVRASLSGTKPEVITQKRILGKRADAMAPLASMFREKKDALETQFILPTPYRGFTDEDNFIDYYPFVPYQFHLIRRVLDAFEEKGFVDKQVHGNERSLIVLTYDIAKDSADRELGHFISFDRFFSTTLKNSMQHMGEMAKRNADTAIAHAPADIDKAFAERVVNVLFMICNMSEVDKTTFAATTDNILTLLTDRVDENRLALRQRLEKVLRYLTDASVIRLEKADDKLAYYVFLTEVESEVSQIIKNKSVDQTTYAEQLKNIFFRYLGNPSNRFAYMTRSFQVGANVYGRHYLSNSSDVEVDFACHSDKQTANELSFGNPKNRLVFFMAPGYKEDETLRNDFAYYCKVQLYAQEQSMSDEYRDARDKFCQRADAIFVRDIVPAFQRLFDSCEVVCGQTVLTAADLENTKGAARYNKALTYLFSQVYSMAGLVNYPFFPRTEPELQVKIRSKADMTAMQEMTEAEKLVKAYLDSQPHDVTVDELVRNFAKPPYGWLNTCTVFAANELVRKQIYCYRHPAERNPSRDFVASRIMKEDAKFTLEVAESIPQTLINDFIAAWKDIFNVMSIKGSNDAVELIQTCRDNDDALLKAQHTNLKTLADSIAAYPFKAPVIEARDLVESWQQVKDAQSFFKTIVEARPSAKTLFDRCKDVRQFYTDQIDKYRKIRDFVEKQKDNFSFLPSDQQGLVDCIKGISTDAEPHQHMAMYNKAFGPLNAALLEKKKELQDKIKVACVEAFAEVQNYATDMNYDANLLPSQNSEQDKRILSENFFALEANADFSAFVNYWYDKINKYVAEHQPKPAVSGQDAGKVTPPATKVTKRVSVVLRGTTLRTAADVDAYVEDIRKQLMKYIDNGDNIIPVK